MGEGGGQILRTALTLSSLAGRPLRIYNIRGRRRDPGLKPQHIVSAHAISHITGGRLEGAYQDSKELFFYPGIPKAGDYVFDIPTAGSVSLVFQTIFFPLCFAKQGSSVFIRGGTHVEWSPSVDYIRDVFLHVLEPSGVDLGIDALRYGFYPAGGGNVEFRITPLALPMKPINVIERGRLKRIWIIAKVANLSLEIAEREIKRARQRLGKMGFEMEEIKETVLSAGKGNFFFILAEFENIRVGFSSLGHIGKRAEAVADESVDGFLRYLDTRGALDRYLSDQIILPMALADGESRVTVGEFTGHLATNVRVIERFLPVRFFLQKKGDVQTVEVRGVGLM